MNRWKILFLLLTGVWLHETLTHVWLGLEGLLPFTSRFFFGLTITPELNTLFIILNTMILIVFAYFGLLHRWGARHHIETHA